MKSKEERQAARAERETARKTKLNERLAAVKEKGDERLAKLDARLADKGGAIKRHDLTPEEFTLDVRENIATAGFGTTSGLKYRWTVQHHGRYVKTGYDFTIRSAQRNAERWIQGVCEGKKRIAV